MSAEPTNVPSKNAGIERQLLALILMSICTVNVGMIQGWLSPMTGYFKSADSQVGVLDNNEVILLETITRVAVSLGGFMHGSVADQFGRKTAIVVAGIPIVVGGLLVTFAESKMMLYIGRATTGISGVMISMGPMYLSETVHESIRGTLISSTSTSLYVGILMSYTLGKYLAYKPFNLIIVGLAVIHVCTTIFLPETPYYLIRKSRKEDALKSLTWLRGGNCETANAELKKIQSLLKVEKLGFRETIKTRQTRMAIMISLVLMTFQTLSGLHIVQSYASMIFVETSSPLSPDDSAIFSTLAFLLATFFCIGLIDIVGRKPMLYFSFVFGFICHLLLSVAHFLHYKGYVVMHLDWISITSIVTFIFTYGIGLGAAPPVITNEVASVKIKPYGSAVTGVASTLSIIFLLRLIPIIYHSVGMYWNFVIAAIANFLGVLFTWFCVPETKGKSLIEIANYMNGYQSTKL